MKADRLGICEGWEWNSGSSGPGDQWSMVYGCAKMVEEGFEAVDESTSKARGRRCRGFLTGETEQKDALACSKTQGTRELELAVVGKQ